MPPFGASIRKPSALPLPTSSNGHVEEKSRVRAIRFRGGWSNAAVCGMVVITSLVWLGLLHIDRVRDGAIFCRSDKDGSGHGLSYFAIGQEDGAHSRLTNFHDDGKRMESVRPKVLAFVGINTGFDSGPRRKVLRETWFPSTPEKLASLEKSTGLVFRFVIGHTADPRKMKALKEEIEEHKDFMCIDAEETYNKLNLKTALELIRPL